MTKKYIYTNRSTPEVIEEVVESVNQFLGDVVEAAGYYKVADGETRRIIGKKGGVDNFDATGTTTYADIIEKSNENGFYVLNPVWFMENRKTVVGGELVPTFDQSTIDSCPDPDDYTGIYFTDDVSEWQPPMPEGL